MDEHDIENLLNLNRFEYEIIPGYVVKFAARRCAVTPNYPHGIRYSLVFKQENGHRIIGFDNAHAPPKISGYMKQRIQYDHLHRSETDKGRPYKFESCTKLLEDFYAEIDRYIAEKGLT
jgi:Family of unknown function (DUF6516)